MARVYGPLEAFLDVDLCLELRNQPNSPRLTSQVLIGLARADHFHTNSTPCLSANEIVIVVGREGESTNSMASAVAASGSGGGGRDDGERMVITPLGAGNEVGRSCVHVSYRGRAVLFDCGVHPAYSGVAALPYFDEIDPAAVDVLLVTHFHLDHAAALPYFLEKVTPILHLNLLWFLSVLDPPKDKTRESSTSHASFAPEFTLV